MKAVLNITPVCAFVFVVLVFGCSKEYSYEADAAKGTLEDSSGICFTQTVHGTFYNGITPHADTAYIEVAVDVQQAGNYAVFTDEVNGFHFEDAGTFADTGINIIKLKPVGTPVATIATGFITKFGTSACAVVVNVKDSTVFSQQQTSDTIPHFDWQFTDKLRDITYKGNFDSNYVHTLGDWTILVLSTKEITKEGDSAFIINIGLPDGVIRPGTYTTDEAPTGMALKTFYDACESCAGGGLLPRVTGGSITFSIKDYDPVTRIVTGSFSGIALDWYLEHATIENGYFSAKVQQ